MRLKKIAGIVASCFLAGALLTGCGGGGGDTAKPQKEQTIKIGMIKYLNASEQKVDEILKKVEEKSGVKLNTHETIFYDNLNMMQMGLDSGSVQEISTYKCVGNYFVAHDPKYRMLKDHSLKMQDFFCFAVRRNDTELLNSLNKALGEMKQDGTLEKLTGEYITDIKDVENPPAVEIQHFDGAETIKVAVTGDLPPLDFISAKDGAPSGFNTAILSEISKRLQKNIEMIPIDSAARAAALTSHQVDVIFWAILPIGDDRPSDIDSPEGVNLSEPYFSDEVVHLDKGK